MATDSKQNYHAHLQSNASFCISKIFLILLVVYAMSIARIASFLNIAHILSLHATLCKPLKKRENRIPFFNDARKT